MTLLLLALGVTAASLDDLSYNTNDGKVTITRCDRAAAGELVIPDTIEGNPVTSISFSSFSSCSSLTKVTIPEGVTSIGSSAFRGCSSLTNIMIPESVTSIGERAFYDCSSLTRITIPDSVTSIEEGAFQDCTSLTSVTIGESVTRIGEYAFEDCTSLTSITIPDSVTSIEEGAFQDCSNLAGITIPDSVNRIGERAFYACTSLTSITIPDSVTSIGVDCFFGSAITNLEIPDRFSSSLAYLGFSPELSHQKLMEIIAANDIATAAVAANTAEINKIKDQLAILIDALAQKDVEIAEKNERIALLENAKDERITFLEEAKVADVVRNLLDEKDDEIAILEQRPTQTEFDAVVTERDARPTPEEIQDARTGSVILTPSEDGAVKLKLEIEESSDLEVWENSGESVEVELPLTEGKKFLRFALK
ncbi:leucine-rich repeat protein [Akkermansiaceae bacterium]|nr:leucine-rich repeat protein [Akkermansiaceae bacterium]